MNNQVNNKEDKVIADSLKNSPEHLPPRSLFNRLHILMSSPRYGIKSLVAVLLALLISPVILAKYGNLLTEPMGGGKDMLVTALVVTGVGVFLMSGLITVQLLHEHDGKGHSYGKFIDKILDYYRN